MEIRVLEYFVAVAQEKNITRAAEQLHITQPTLSRQLMALEEELGKPLLVRGKRSVTLTDEGEILLKHAEEILQLVRRTESEITQTNPVAGDVWVGAGETRGIHTLTKTAALLHERYPDIHYHLFSGIAEDVLDRMNSGLLDFALVCGPGDYSDYEQFYLPYSDSWGVLMRRDDPLANLEVIHAKDLQDRPLLFPSQGNDNKYLQHWVGTPNVVAQYNLILNASFMVEDGLGVAVGFDHLIQTGQDTPLITRPLAGFQESAIRIIWKKEARLSKAAALFLEHLKKSTA